MLYIYMIIICKVISFSTSSYIMVVNGNRKYLAKYQTPSINFPCKGHILKYLKKVHLKCKYPYNGFAS